jgi:hypothetical protein
MLEDASGSLSDMIENLVAGGAVAIYERSDSLGAVAEVLEEVRDAG